jgi:hypothetical protein
MASMGNMMIMVSFKGPLDDYVIVTIAQLSQTTPLQVFALILERKPCLTRCVAAPNILQADGVTVSLCGIRCRITV